AGLGGERRPVRVDAGVGVAEGPVDLQGASIAEYEVNAGDEATSCARDEDLTSAGDAEAVKHHGDFVRQIADGGHATFCDGACSCFTEPSTGVIGVAVVVPPLAGRDSASMGLGVVGGNPDVGLVNDAGGQAKGAPLVHAGGGAEYRAMLRLDLRGGTGELDFTHGALEGLPLFKLVRAESVTASAGASRLSPVAKPHRVRLVGDGADGALTVHMVGHGSKSTTGFMGKVWDGWESPAAFQRWNREWVAACYRVLKPGGHLLAFGGTRTWHRLAVAIEDAGFEIRDSLAWLYGTGFSKSWNFSTRYKGQWCICLDDGAFRGRPECSICGGLNPEYKGFGTGLKPSHEPVVVARKPMATTVAANVLEHGTGALNIDACRISAGEGDDLHRARISGFSDSAIYGTSNGYGMQAAPSGRWPANVILDEHMAGALDEQSGVLKSGARTPTGGEQKGDVYGLGHKTSGTNTFASSEGGASRFFYVAKAPKRERPEVNGVKHTTVKPLTLMRYLVRMVTPPNGIVLDPFAGSGTTIEAALLEG